MASSTLILQSLLSSSTNSQLAFPRTHSFVVHNTRRRSNFAAKCSSKPEPKDQFLDLTPAPESINTTSAEKFPIEKRRRSEIVRDRKQRGIVKPEPPNFEIGWKRTKEINLEKPKGYVIMDFLEKFESLMASVKEARARCRQAILVANSF